MPRFWGTVAFRLALSHGLLAIGSMSVISAAFYFGTVGVLERSTDGKLVSLSKRLAEHFDSRGDDRLRQEIQQLLADGIEQDTEIYLLVGARWTKDGWKRLWVDAKERTAGQLDRSGSDA